MTDTQHLDQKPASVYQLNHLEHAIVQALDALNYAQRYIDELRGYQRVEANKLMVGETVRHPVTNEWVRLSGVRLIDAGQDGPSVELAFADQDLANIQRIVGYSEIIDRQYQSPF